MNRRARIAALAAAVAGLSALPSAATAAPICRGGAVGTTSVFLCFEVKPNVYTATVAPEVYFCPVINGRPDACVSGPVAELGRTGFEPSPLPPRVTVDPATGTIRSTGGTLGTVVVNGTRVPVKVSSFCVGDPSAC